MFYSGQLPMVAEIVDAYGASIYPEPYKDHNLEFVSARYVFNNDPEDDTPDHLVMTYRLVTE